MTNHQNVPPGRAISADSLLGSESVTILKSKGDAAHPMLEAYIIRKIREEEEERRRKRLERPRIEKPYYPPEPPPIAAPQIAEDDSEENNGAIEIEI